MLNLNKTLSLFLFCLGLNLFAQEMDQQQTGSPDSVKSDSFWSTASEYIKISGEAGMYGESYSISGRESRRPGSSGRMYFRPSISLFDRIILNFDLFLSSEGSGAKQDINTIGFTPEWSWGKFHYGDFSMPVSQFTLTDVNINGYGLELTPGIFRLQIASGKTQKAVIDGSSNSAFERTIYGGKLGLGDEGGWHFHFNFVRSYDDKNSVPRTIFQKVDTIVTGSSVRIDTTYKGVTPKENLITGVNWGMALFNNSFRLKNEIAVSLFTADLYSDVVNNKDIPEEISKYYTPRLTTNADAALYSEMAIQTTPFNLKTAYTLVGPGYTSLGMGSLINDRQIINNLIGLNLFSGGLVIQTNFQQQTDNTSNQKLYTTKREVIGVMVAMRPFKWMSLTVNSTGNTMGNNSKNDTLKVDNTTKVLIANITLMFKLFNIDHNLTTGISNTNTEAKSKIRGDNEVVSENPNVSLTSLITKQLSVTLGFVSNTTDLGPRGKNINESLTAKLGYKMFDDKLQNAISYSNVKSSMSTVGALTFQSSYQVFQQSSIVLQYRGNYFNGKGPRPISFKEHTTTLTWAYRF